MMGKRYEKGTFWEGEVAACVRPTDTDSRICSVGTQVNSYIPNLSNMWNGRLGCGVAGTSLDEFNFFSFWIILTWL